MKYSLTLLIVAILTSTSFLVQATSTLTSPYAGEEARVIKSLWAKDIDDLLNGRGWGLAKPAELNGVPGPVHLLELKSEIGLSSEQVSAIILGGNNAMRHNADTDHGLHQVGYEKSFDIAVVTARN